MVGCVDASGVGRVADRYDNAGLSVFPDDVDMYGEGFESEGRPDSIAVVVGAVREFAEVLVDSDMFSGEVVSPFVLWSAGCEYWCSGVECSFFCRGFCIFDRSG